MTRWSARFRAYTPVDTADTIDTKAAGGSDEGVCVNRVHCVKGGISGEAEESPLPPVTPAETDAEIETLAEALMAAHLSTSGCGVTDREKARLYYRAEAMRRLDLLRQRARDAVSGPDEEREAIMGEPVMALPQPATVAGLLLAASPLAGTPGAVACRSCSRGIWCSPSWRGPQPPDLCATCWAAENLAQRSREEAGAAANCERADSEREGTP